MGLVQASSNITNIKETEERFRFITLFLSEMQEQFNGNIEILKNLKVKLISARFSAADTNTSVTHGLGFTPNGYILVGASAAMSLYDGTGTTNTTVKSLKSSATGTASILFF